ncbi:UDP-N-acetylmuramate dehydrogenase [Bifidobacterium bombi DSM 19703]|uniref:UDP-N-acetylenolpyruvoylglucosamine reductase n=2 Tax=Bifidobacterium bombi TaxID=471511 RepID=A0A086BNT4_9BIFI|nr:UDP-N-acetylmuramate dehydrogenase [Bifidobacterium bombi DSM 19703]
MTHSQANLISAKMDSRCHHRNDVVGRASEGDTPRFADITTMGVGGRIARFVQPQDTRGFIDAVRAADGEGRALCIIGGGSNLLADDGDFPGVVVRDARREIVVEDASIRRREPAEADGPGGAAVCEGIADSAGVVRQTGSDAAGVAVKSQGAKYRDGAQCGRCGKDMVLLSATAGTNWDDFVLYCTQRGFSGVQGLSGIPGTVGASVVQNIGAYGQEVADCVDSVDVWDRLTSREIRLSRGDCEFGYRTSLLKASMYRAPGVPADRFFPTPRFVVLSVRFRLLKASDCTVTSGQLASVLGVGTGDSMPGSAVRAAVIAVRARKGMLEDPYRYDGRWMAGTRRLENIEAAKSQLDRELQDSSESPKLNAGAPHAERARILALKADRHSCGSFFMNPILTEEQARHLPADAPRYPVDVGVSSPLAPGHDASPLRERPEGSSVVKTSAAWLIDHAGFHKGFVLADGSGRAGLSDVHTLALTNRGGASSDDVLRLAQAIKRGVLDSFGVVLVPEPVVLGSTIG